jgi:hypothetical protein
MRVFVFILPLHLSLSLSNRRFNLGPTGSATPELKGDDDIEEEVLDPRVQVELEKLNACTEDINALELQLEDASALFRTLLSDSTQQV